MADQPTASNDDDIEGFLRQRTWKLAEAITFLESKPEGTWTAEDHDRVEELLFKAMNALSRHRLASAAQEMARLARPTHFVKGEPDG